MIECIARSHGHDHQGDTVVRKKDAAFQVHALQQLMDCSIPTKYNIDTSAFDSLLSQCSARANGACLSISLVEMKHTASLMMCMTPCLETRTHYRIQ